MPTDAALLAHGSRRRFEGGLFNDTDTRRLVYPDARCRLSCRVQAMRDLRLPESMALAEGEAGEDVKLLPNGKLDDVVNQYSVRPTAGVPLGRGAWPLPALTVEAGLLPAGAAPPVGRGGARAVVSAPGGRGDDCGSLPARRRAASRLPRLPAETSILPCGSAQRTGARHPPTTAMQTKSRESQRVGLRVGARSRGCFSSPGLKLASLISEPTTRGGRRRVQEHMRLKQQFESRQLDWAQWMRTTKFAGAGPPNSGSGFVGAVSYTAPAWDTNQRGRGEVYPASQSALNDHWRGVGSKPDRPAVSM